MPVARPDIIDEAHNLYSFLRAAAVIAQVPILVAQVLLLLLAAWRDVATRLIPNQICLALAVIGLASRLAHSPMALLTSVLLGAAVLVLLLVPHSYRALGGGDVKLLVALTLGLPPYAVLGTFVAIALAGGMLALATLAMRHLPRPRLSQHASRLRRVYAVERWRVLRHAPLPYGAAIACGGLWTLLHTIGV